MKKIALLLIVMLFMAVSCKTGPLKDIRLGKNFGIYAEDKILVHKAPSQDSETFLVKTPQAFLVEDIVCEDGMGMFSCFTDLAMSKDDPEMARVAYYKVSFELGGEGYINANYFYPELADYIISEEATAQIGKTPSDYAREAREEYAQNELKVKKVFERVEEILMEAEALRNQLLDEHSWPEEEKARLRNHEVWIGNGPRTALFFAIRPRKERAERNR